MDQDRRLRVIRYVALAVCMFLFGLLAQGWMDRSLPSPKRPQLNILNSSGVPLGVSYGTLQFEIPSGMNMGFRIDCGDNFRLAGTVAGRDVSRDVPFWPGSIPQVQAEVVADAQGQLKVRYLSPDE